MLHALQSPVFFVSLLLFFKQWTMQEKLVHRISDKLFNLQPLALCEHTMFECTCQCPCSCPSHIVLSGLGTAGIQLHQMVLPGGTV